mmetsp:Transcript_57180/g.94997  ORF Transcript_57180/g.94997 Transcript_57180/m.94997 type:complete len:340 (-) Transcript_57180:808-1827(-)
MAVDVAHRLDLIECHLLLLEVQRVALRTPLHVTTGLHHIARQQQLQLHCVYARGITDCAVTIFFQDGFHHRILPWLVAFGPRGRSHPHIVAHVAASATQVIEEGAIGTRPLVRLLLWRRRMRTFQAHLAAVVKRVQCIVVQRGGVHKVTTLRHLDHVHIVLLHDDVKTFALHHRRSPFVHIIHRQWSSRSRIGMIQCGVGWCNSTQQQRVGSQPNLFEPSLSMLRDDRITIHDNQVAMVRNRVRLFDLHLQCCNRVRTGQIGRDGRHLRGINLPIQSTTRRKCKRSHFGTHLRARWFANADAMNCVCAVAIASRLIMNYIVLRHQELQIALQSGGRHCL